MSISGVGCALVLCLALAGCRPKPNAPVSVTVKPAVSAQPQSAPVAESRSPSYNSEAPTTGQADYRPLAAGQFDASLQPDYNVTVETWPADSPNRPATDAEGNQPDIQTDKDGKQVAVYHNRTPIEPKVSISEVDLEPFQRADQSMLLKGTIVVSNLTPFHMTDAQLVFFNGETASVLVAPAAVLPNQNPLAGKPLPSHEGMVVPSQSYHSLYARESRLLELHSVGSAARRPARVRNRGNRRRRSHGQRRWPSHPQRPPGLPSLSLG